jgi:hypothetical protein
MENELLDEASFQTWEEWQAEEWRRTCALTHADILRICSLSSFVDSMTTVWKRMDESL